MNENIFISCPNCKTESETKLWVTIFGEDEEPNQSMCPACKIWYVTDILESKPKKP